MPVRLLQLSPEDGKLTGLHSKLTVTSHDTDLALAENEEVIFGVNNKDRPLLDLPARLLQHCEVHEFRGGSGNESVICVLKLCYICSPILMTCTCTCNCSMHISAHATAPCTFSTCNCSMQIQHLHVLAQARPTMSCIPLVASYACADNVHALYTASQ